MDPLTLTPADAETELFSEHFGLEFGFRVTVDYHTPYAGRIWQHVLHNVTEVHWKYDEVGIVDELGVAFESDLLGTGCTRKVNIVASVFVVPELDMYSSLQQLQPTTH